jgi:hypothetical protein
MLAPNYRTSPTEQDGLAPGPETEDNRDAVRSLTFLPAPWPLAR